MAVNILETKSNVMNWYKQFSSIRHDAIHHRRNKAKRCAKIYKKSRTNYSLKPQFRMFQFSKMDFFVHFTQNFDKLFYFLISFVHLLRQRRPQTFWFDKIMVSFINY